MNKKIVQFLSIGLLTLGISMIAQPVISHAWTFTISTPGPLEKPMLQFITLTQIRTRIFGTPVLTKNCII